MQFVEKNRRHNTMVNLWLFVLTFSTYSLVYWLLKRPQGFKSYVKRVFLLVLLTMPFNINGNVFTVIGNAESEKDVYSIFSLYQRAGDDALTFIGVSFYQRARNEAVAYIGAVGYQKAGRKTSLGVALAAYQYVTETGNERAFAFCTSLE